MWLSHAHLHKLKTGKKTTGTTMSEVGKQNNVSQYFLRLNRYLLKNELINLFPHIIKENFMLFYLEMYFHV